MSDVLPPAIEAMIGALAPSARVELRRALHLQLYPAPTAKERRERELGSLARLLRTHGVWPPGATTTTGSAGAPAGGAPAGAQGVKRRVPAMRGPLSRRQRWPTLDRTLYDGLRDPDAPTSETLLRRHHAPWVQVCRAAASLPIDGEAALIDGGCPWHSGIRGGPGTRSRAPYTDEECIDAIVRCANATGRRVDRLTVTVYREWSGAQRRRARSRARTRDRLAAIDPRLPDYEVIRSRFGGWPQARLRAARDAK